MSELIDLLAIANQRNLARRIKQREISLGEVSYHEGQLRAAADQIKLGIAKFPGRRRCRLKHTNTLFELCIALCGRENLHLIR